MTAYIQGLSMGGGLIVAIGAQNAFVLTQGVRGRHALPVALVCIACDVVLLSLGVAGVGSVVASSPWLMQVAAWGGAAFLGWYGLGAFRSAHRGGAMQTGTAAEETLGHTLLVTLAVTLLNPHVYLDTVVLMGSVSGRIPIPSRYWFGAGAITASTLWFFALTAGGRLLAPLFGRPSTWRVLDIVVGLTMWGVAASLFMSLYGQ